MKALFSSILLLAVLIFSLLQPVAAQVPAPVVLTADTAPAGVQPALARDESALADTVRKVLRTLPQTKKRFLAGLANGDQFLLSVQVVDTDISFRQATVRVLGWHGSIV